MNTNTPLKPRAKSENLVIQELPHELLIYDLESNRAFNLNRTSALVWQNCDGQKSTSEIAQILEKVLKQKVTEDLVWLTLDRLSKETLISFDKAEIPLLTSHNRRELIKKIGFSTLVALPVVTGLVAPSAVSAQSTTCRNCVKKQNGVGGCPVECGPTQLGSCYDNSGCGRGQLVAVNVTCQSCFNGDHGRPPGPGGLTVSWEL